MDLIKTKITVLSVEKSSLIEQPIHPDKTVQEIARYLSHRHYALNTHVFEKLQILSEDHAFDSLSNSKPSRLICCVGSLPTEPRQIPQPQGEPIGEVLILTETHYQSHYESSGYSHITVGIGTENFFPEFDVSLSLNDELITELPKNWGEFRYQQGWVFLLSDEAAGRLIVKTDRTVSLEDQRHSVNKEIRFLLPINKNQNGLSRKILDFQVTVKFVTPKLAQLWQVNNQDRKVPPKNIRLLIGGEVGLHDIQLTSNITIKILREALARRHEVPVNQVYLFQAIPLPISQTAEDLHQIAQSAILYVARDLYTSRKTSLTLEDVQHGSQCAWIIPPLYGPDNPVFVGRKSGTENQTGTVHIDLSLTGALNVKRISHKQCVVYHKDGEWFVKRHNHAKSGREIFVNTQRVLPDESVSLNDGDSLTFGLSTQDLSVRLQVRLDPYDRDKMGAEVTVKGGTT